MHLGGLRTALYSYALARQWMSNDIQKKPGKFFLRIEDTDASRTVAGAVERIVNVLDRVGLERDGAIIQQSRRIPLYRNAADKLVHKHHAYYCFCSKERLDELRSIQSGSNQPTRYDGKCSHIPRHEAERRVAAGEPYTIRMKSPMIGETVVQDEVVGKVKFANLTAMDDQVLIKNDGWPTYHLASIVDDHDMQITHVVRGDEWLSSTPKHLALYGMLGWEPPKFAHLPLLLTPDGKKLSKRSPMGASVESLLDRGYLPSALLNFVALLGWGVNAAAGVTDDDVVLNKSEFIAKFSLNRVNRSAAVVDEDRLSWLNGMHIRRAVDSKDDPFTLDLVRNAIRSECEKMDMFNENEIDNIIFLLKDRVRFPADFVRLGGHCFQSQIQLKPFPAEIIANGGKTSLQVLCAVNELLDTQKEQSYSQIDSLHTKLGCRKRDVLGCIRWALTGQSVGAPISDTIRVLGVTRAIERLRYARRTLEQELTT